MNATGLLYHALKYARRAEVRLAGRRAPGVDLRSWDLALVRTRTAVAALELAVEQVGGDRDTIAPVRARS
jgi:hypothetical protein